MGVLSARLLAETQRNAAAVAPVLDIALLSGTTLRFASAAAPQTPLSLGTYEARVLSWGRLRREMSDLDGNFQSPAMEVEVDNADRGLSPYVFQLRGRPATLRMVSPLVAAADYTTLFPFILVDYVRKGKSWVLQLRMDDAWLRTQFPKRTFQAGEWPNIHASAVGKPVPTIYGSHSDLGMGGQGMVPAYYVDTSGFGRFAVAGHYCKAMPRVYRKNDATPTPTLITAGVDYDLTYPVVSGQQYTLIAFRSPGPGANPVVTVDVDGIESVGNGSGTLITNGAQQLQHLLDNWIFGDYRKGAWAAAGSSPIDLTSFGTAASFFSDMGHVGARWIGENMRTGLEELRTWCDDWFVQNYPTSGGKLGLYVFDHRTQNANVYPSDRIVESQDVLMGDLAEEMEERALVARVLTRWAPRGTDGQYLQTREDRDPASLANGIQITKESRWLPAATGYANQARDVASRRMNRFRSLIPKIHGSLHLDAVDRELGASSGLTWGEGINEDATVGYGDRVWQRRLVLQAAQEFDLDAMNVSAELHDVQPAMTTFAASFLSKKSPAGQEDGSYYLGPGNWPTCARASSKWVDDPTPDYVIPLGTNVLPIDRQGLLVEEAATNDLLNPGFTLGLTSWTQTPSGATIALDSGDLLLDGTVSPNSVTITAPAGGGGAMGGNATISQACASAYTSTGAFTISLDHKDDTGQALSVFIQRSSDGLWLNVVAGTWGAPFANKFPVATGITRHDFRGLTAGAAATITAHVGIEKATAVASQKHHIYHVQVERTAWPSSRIVSTTVAGTRAVETVKVANTLSGFDVWPVSQGTLVVYLSAPLWNSADRPSGNKPYLFSLEYDANNKWEIYWDNFALELAFKITSGGVVKTARSTNGYSGSVAAFRWTSSNGELGLAPGTATVFTGGVKGDTEAVYTTPPTRANGKDLYIGCKTGSPGTSQWGGAINSVRIYPFALSDAYLTSLTSIPF